MIEFVQGNMFNESAVAHGCNCEGVMGAGVANVVRQLYPQAYETYREECRARRFHPGRVHHWSNGTEHVFNLATQQKRGPHASLDAIAGALSSMIPMAEGAGVAIIGIPRIGCGIGGLKWADVRPVILLACEGSTRVLVRVYELPEVAR